MKFNILGVFLLSTAVSFVWSQEAVQLPETEGPYVTGVNDFEFTRPVDPQEGDLTDSGTDSQTRRLMARVWYPICRKDPMNEEGCSDAGSALGRRRLYFEVGEAEATVPAGLNAFSYFQNLSAAETQSYLDAAPLLVEQGPFPVLIYSTGATGWVSSNTVLLQELASHGMIAVSLAHTGGLTGVQFPNGDVIPIDDDYVEALQENNGLRSTDTAPMNSSDLGVRFEGEKQFLQDGRGLAKYNLQWVNDEIALANYMEETARTNSSSLFGQLLGSNNNSISSLVYIGGSFGGGAAAVAAHKDPRANCAINMDGVGQSLDVFDASLRVPLLLFVTSTTLKGNYFENEFFYEPVQSMGSDPKIFRIKISEMTHTDFYDVIYGPEDVRQAFGGGTLDGMLIHDMLQSYFLGFITTTCLGDGNWTLETTFQQFPNTAEVVDVSYVSEWWAASESPPPAAGPTSMSLEDSSATTPTGIISSLLTATSLLAALLTWE
ncbi:Platelet-activating factor acetylhydrolase, isoform II [Seminavis robusta]|uniref:1-alkyl-2-acetylglycerophosphocholine esterase n=1 Tax=Seminavis robusta TaxID=568900 RepID=A0A9N8E771_9STRA|nr:Platelet-activating factor acetylhydrolase, isoform II [Seminavis robusta]|eukprot:Sro586_g171180.1 Platelet-activating factor acetylhydrolase, isoform II (490) ;mRNA; f:34912-36381